MNAWSSKEDIRQHLRRLWERGLILGATLGGERVFPLRLPLRRPHTQELAEQFPAAREWIAALVSAAKEGSGPGYTLEWREFNHRQLGRNRIPVAAIIETEEDGLAIIGKKREGTRFRELAAKILDPFPSLAPWLKKRPLTALEYSTAWPRLLATLDWMVKHPRPGIYLRQMDAPGIDTKFIEGHRGLLGELLDLILTPAAIDQQHTNFAKRYGFKSKPMSIRFRFLDPILRINGLSDLSVTEGEFTQLDLPTRRIFITENEINFLAFPNVPGSLVLFGSGYGFDHLGKAIWLKEKPIFYWGDIDTHGFAILDQLRSHFPAARSLLMDMVTLLEHQPFWGREDRPTTRDLERLQPEEAALYDSLRYNHLAPALRLEQERIGFPWLEAAVKDLIPAE